MAKLSKLLFRINQNYSVLNQFCQLFQYIFKRKSNNPYGNIKFQMSEFVAEEERIEQALHLLCEVVVCAKRPLQLDQPFFAFSLRRDRKDRVGVLRVLMDGAGQINRSIGDQERPAFRPLPANLHGAVLYPASGFKKLHRAFSTVARWDGHRHHPFSCWMYGAH